MNEELKAIKELVGNARNSRAIQRLRALDLKSSIPDPDLVSDIENTLEKLGADQKRLERKSMMGLLDRKDENLENNNIIFGLLGLIDLIGNNVSIGFDNEKTNNDQNQGATQVSSSSNNTSKPEVRKILFLVANPEDTTRLNILEELKRIKENLQSSNNRDSFIIDFEFAVTADSLSNAIMRQKPNIIHFSGHGSEWGKIVIEKVGGGKEYVSPLGLANLIKIFKKNIECVVLNACYSEDQADEIVKHIQFVVGMETAISDKKAAIPFASAFYSALGNGEDYEIAFEFANARMNLTAPDLIEGPVLKKKDS